MATAWRWLGFAVLAMVAVKASRLSLSDASAAKKLAFVKKTVSSHGIVIFSKSYCPYCRRAKAVFKKLKKEPYVLELDQRGDGSEIQDALSEMVGRRAVPQVFIHGKHLGGSDDTVEAYENGTILTLLDIDSTNDL
ncbi:glutaredoxin-C8 [Canna indica]|uniref:Glutaredoxin-C8 n=1 Tax=Canna indica TaxID=4628 RepID=A0AAQ3JRM3_9LILI|nr:glutaredoxin-C8 [Canna indica]